MKLIVETRGDTQVYAGPDNHARHDRPSVVSNLQLMQMKIASGDLNLLGQVNGDATDEAFANTLAEAKGDTELAVQAFMAEFPILPADDAEGEGEDEKPKRGRRKAAADDE